MKMDACYPLTWDLWTSIDFCNSGMEHNQTIISFLFLDDIWAEIHLRLNPNEYTVYIFFYKSLILHLNNIQMLELSGQTHMV